MSKITNDDDGLTRSGTGCFIAVPNPYGNSGRQRVKLNLTLLTRCTVAEWYGVGLATASCGFESHPRAAAAVYQRQLSVPSLLGRLMSTIESWGVNGHTTRCTGPWSCGFGSCPAKGQGNGDQRRPMGHKARERTKNFTFLLTCPICIIKYAVIQWATLICISCWK